MTESIAPPHDHVERLTKARDAGFALQVPATVVDRIIAAYFYPDSDERRVVVAATRRPGAA